MSEEKTLFEACWIDYEEDGHFRVFEKEGKLFIEEWGHYILGDHHEIIEVDQEEALKEMLEWEEHED